MNLGRDIQYHVGNKFLYSQPWSSDKGLVMKYSFNAII